MTGAIGETIASWWLADRGLQIIDRNRRVGRGEIDLIVRDGRQTVVVEVRANTRNGDPIDAIDDTKRSHVRRLAGVVGAGRVDLVGIGLGPEALTVHWVPG